MAQLTVYIDDETRRRIELAAKRADKSVSQWVKQRLTHALQTEWPDDYFDVLGSLSGTDLERPEPLRAEDDAPRESV